MAKVNRGKQFEECVQQAFEKIPDVAVTRLFDPQAGYAGVSNICDFIIYRKPTIFYIECKSCYGNTLSIYSNNPKRKYGDISNKQWDGLLDKADCDGVVSGYLMWFIDHDRTIFVPARDLAKLRSDGDVSFNITHWDKGDWLEISGDKKKILFNYDMNSLLDVYSK